MSYGVYIYSKSDKVLSRENLRERMNSYGWDILFQQGFANATVTVEGPMEGEVIVGWRPAEISLDAVRRVIVGNDNQALGELYGDQTLVGVEICVHAPVEIDPEEIEGMAEYKSPEELEFVRTAKSQYSVSTSAGRSPASFEFQEYIARSIAELTDGWVEDPQSGESGTAEELPMPAPWQQTIQQIPEGKKPWYSIYFCAIIGAMGLFAAIMGRSPLNLKNWTYLLYLLLGVVALGLFRGNRWARTAGISISGILLLSAIAMLLSQGMKFHYVIFAYIHVRIILELLSPEVKAYFD